jgi:hypothetical protein
LILFSFASFKISDLLNVYIMIDCLTAFILYYFLRKYVRFKLQ